MWPVSAATVGSIGYGLATGISTLRILEIFCHFAQVGREDFPTGLPGRFSHRFTGIFFQQVYRDFFPNRLLYNEGILYTNLSYILYNDSRPGH